jgi:signal transduction histidine kinase
VTWLKLCRRSQPPALEGGLLGAEGPHDRRTDSERIAQLERLIEVSRSLTSTLALHPLLQQIVAAAKELTGVEACSILLRDGANGDLYYEAASGGEGFRMRPVSIPVEGSIAGRAVQTAKPVIVEDVSRDERFYRESDAEFLVEPHCVLVCPLVARENVIGVLEAVNKRDRGAFKREDVELLSVLSDQAAVAVQNALLFQQSDLVSDIVHEMRTPLTSIIAYAELIERTGTSSAQRLEFAKIIQHEAERIRRMVSDLLELAGLESGRISLASDPVDLKTVIHMVVNVSRPQATEQRITLRMDLPQGVPRVVGDAQRIHQVLLNLVNNAVKYSGQGDEVVVSARREGDLVRVSVSDTGPGIPQEALPNLFKRFYRVPDLEDQASGTGLGLAICRKIVDAHGGTIGVESEVGKGSTFTFALPTEKSPNPHRS